VIILEIVFIIESLGLGGAERVVTVLSKSLMRYYNKVSIITFYRKEKEYQLDDAVQRINLDIPVSNIGKLIIGTLKLYRFMKKDKNTVYISFDILPNIISLMVNILLHRKLIIAERNAPKEANISNVSRILRKFLYPTGKCFVFQTKQAKECYPKKIQRKGYIIGNPIKESIPIRKADAVTNDIVSIGRLEKQKNYPLLLDAFEQFLDYKPNYTLHIYGEGSCRKELEVSIREKGLENKVFLCGSRNNVHELIRSSKVYVMSSDYEGMPNALMEAMAMGFPVISTDCPSGGPRTLIKNGINGILVPTGNREELTKSMLRICGDDVFREQMAEKAKYINEQYSQENIVKEWVKCINKYNIDKIDKER